MEIADAVLMAARVRSGLYIRKVARTSFGYFLKMARTGKRHGLDAHHTLEFDKRPEAPELRLLLNPNYFQAYQRGHLIVSIIGVSTRIPRRVLIAVALYRRV